MKNIIQKIAKLRCEFTAEKKGFNRHENFSYYLIDDIYQAKQKMQELGLAYYVNQEVLSERMDVITKRGTINVPIYKFTMFVTDGENTINFSHVTPHFVSPQTSTTTTAQEAGANTTYAMKYLLGMLLMLDDGMTDPDSMNNNQDSEPEKPKATTPVSAPAQGKQEPEMTREPEKNSPAELTERYRNHFKKTLSNIAEDEVERAELGKASETYTNFIEWIENNIKSQYRRGSNNLSVAEMKDVLMYFKEERKHDWIEI